MSSDRERLADTEHVLHGPEGSGAVRRVLYAVYVGAILAFTYGFTVARAVLLESQPTWVRATLLTPRAGAVATATGILLLVVVHAVGRRRGPAVPPLPWIDHVVASALDRALTLREWWVVSATLVVAGSAVAGAVLGGSLWAARATGPGALLAGVATGIGLGAALALAWLSGQVASVGADRRGARWSRPWLLPGAALRRLTLDGVRSQAVRSSHLGGAVLAGDLRAARLEVAAPVRRGRRLRLRSRGPVLTVAARDVLGLRRQPGLVAFGLALALPGAAGATWALCEPQVPPVLAVVAVAVVYLGAGVWSEGARLLGDTMGTPRLSGLDVRTEAAAHTITPAAVLLAVALPVAIAIRATTAAPPPVADVLAWWLGIAALVIATTLVSAFRGRPPQPAFSPRAGPFLVLAWYGRPLLAVALAGGLLTTAAAHRGALALPGLGMLGAVALTAAWARHSVDRGAVAHRG